jgi:hypothetical protein
VNEKYWVYRLSAAWPDGGYYVEVSEGDDTASPDAMGTKYKELGEGRGYENPREAAIAAIRIARQWKKDGHRGEEIEVVLCANGKFAGEMGVPADDMTVKELLLWARKEYESMVRCDNCNELVGRETYKNWDDDDVYCSEYCAEEGLRRVYEDIWSEAVYTEEDYF